MSVQVKWYHETTRKYKTKVNLNKLVSTAVSIATVVSSMFLAHTVQGYDCFWEYRNVRGHCIITVCSHPINEEPGSEALA